MTVEPVVSESTQNNITTKTSTYTYDNGDKQIITEVVDKSKNGEIKTTVKKVDKLSGSSSDKEFYNEEKLVKTDGDKVTTSHTIKSKDKYLNSGSGNSSSSNYLNIIYDLDEEKDKDDDGNETVESTLRKYINISGGSSGEMVTITVRKNATEDYYKEYRNSGYTYERETEYIGGRILKTVEEYETYQKDYRSKTERSYTEFYEDGTFYKKSIDGDRNIEIEREGNRDNYPKWGKSGPPEGGLLEKIWYEVEGMTREMIKFNGNFNSRANEFREEFKTQIKTLVAGHLTNTAVTNEINSNLHELLRNAFAQMISGKDTPEEAKEENNLADVVSKVITGNLVDDLILDDENGYNTTLNGRLKKLTELYTGIQTGLYDEDEVEEKLSTMNINDLDSIEEQLGSIDEVAASFMMNEIRRNSNFMECLLDPDGNFVESSTAYDSGETGYYYSGSNAGMSNRKNQERPEAQTVCEAPVEERKYHRKTNSLIEIERAIKALVLSYVHGDLKGEIRMAEMKKEKYPTNIPKDLWEDMKHAYSKTAGDFTTQLNKFDPSQADNHPYHSPCSQTREQRASNTPCTPHDGYERDGKLNITDRLEEKN